MKVTILLDRLIRIAESHLKCCTGASKANCNGVEELLSIIKDNPVNVRAARGPCKYPHFANPPQVEIHEVVREVKPPTWINRDGEEVIIESMSAAHLANAINFVERVRTEQGEAALDALKAEMKKRWAMKNPFADMGAVLDNADL